uniref:Uncharacterized protein n=1 Tax=Glossina brevipalpis TaxID=37001 RepID=A0A1A9WCH8_9MUSC
MPTKQNTANNVSNNRCSRHILLTLSAYPFPLLACFLLLESLRSQKLKWKCEIYPILNCLSCQVRQVRQVQQVLYVKYFMHFAVQVYRLLHNKGITMLFVFILSVNENVQQKKHENEIKINCCCCMTCDNTTKNFISYAEYS